ncbi:Uncharacterised protein [Vibrio cholerae]|nr:Uncharacterised protein [Vibrio cholerae]
MTNLVTIKVMKSCVFSPNYFRASSLTIIFVVVWEVKSSSSFWKIRT